MLGSVYIALSECVCVCGGGAHACMHSWGGYMCLSQVVSIYLSTGSNLQQTVGVTAM